MKIFCETQVINRNTQVGKMARPLKSTLAVGFHTSAKNANGECKKELEILHFTAQNKAGTRYKIRDNIEKLFVKFMEDGKATISFRAPPENLMIKCDPIQLKAFFQTLKLGMDGKKSINLAGNIASMSALTQKQMPQNRLTITKRGDYPTKGFPRALKELTIQGIQLSKITFEICSLRNLTKLDLNSNLITKLPAELGRLPLKEFNVSFNVLGDSNDWQWMQGKNIQKSLLELDMSKNRLKYFPKSVIKFESLVTLKMTDNSIKRIPFSVRRMQNLRNLHLSSNEIQSLPSIFDNKRLDVLDVWGNKFEPASEQMWDTNANQPIYLPAAQPNPLWLLAARTVQKFRLPYTPATLPWLLCDILSESPLCACGKLCYGGDVLERVATPHFYNIKNLIFSRDRLIYADIVLCGAKCAGRKQFQN